MPKPIPIRTKRPRQKTALSSRSPTLARLRREAEEAFRMLFEAEQDLVGRFYAAYLKRIKVPWVSENAGGAVPVGALMQALELYLYTGEGALQDTIDPEPLPQAEVDAFLDAFPKALAEHTRGERFLLRVTSRRHERHESITDALKESLRLYVARHTQGLDSPDPW